MNPKKEIRKLAQRLIELGGVKSLIELLAKYSVTRVVDLIALTDFWNELENVVRHHDRNIFGRRLVCR